RTLLRQAGGTGFFATTHTTTLPSPDGRLLAATAATYTVVLIDPTTGRELAALPGRREQPLAFERSGALLTAGPDGLTRWPITYHPSRPGVRRLGPPERLYPTGNIDVWGASRDGQVVAMPNYNAGAIVLRRDRPPVALRAQEDVRSCAVSPDGRWAATGSHN